MAQDERPHASERLTDEAVRRQLRERAEWLLWLDARNENDRSSGAHNSLRASA